MLHLNRFCAANRIGVIRQFYFHHSLAPTAASVRLVRKCSTKSLQTEQPVPELKADSAGPNVAWNTIYHFPGIMLTASIKRLRLYPIAFAAFTVPVSIALAYSEICSIMTSQICGSLGLSSTLTLLLFSYFTNNLVGYVYTDERLLHVKISYVDFHGKRQDRVYPIDEIVPRTELGRSLFKFYFPVKNPNNTEVYKLIHRYGQIYDVQAFSTVFGKD
ncbi:transmembrane protein 186 [Sabethes cyaneus]|uniref:transmembrane protein 186 n=1 Tax=Sabethes cyaneus TaxID=53552 RepID=UPI00237EAD68|nr:transmembrane protein 186 [Sabethes cyaneus]